MAKIPLWIAKTLPPARAGVSPLPFRLGSLGAGRMDPAQAFSGYERQKAALAQGARAYGQMAAKWGQVQKVGSRITALGGQAMNVATRQNTDPRTDPLRLAMLTMINRARQDLALSKASRIASDQLNNELKEMNDHGDYS